MRLKEIFRYENTNDYLKKWSEDVSIATVRFDLYRSNYELNKGGLEMFWKIYVKTSCGASATCGTFENILIEQCEALASSLKDLLSNTQN